MVGELHVAGWSIAGWWGEYATEARRRSQFGYQRGLESEQSYSGAGVKGKERQSREYGGKGDMAVLFSRRCAMCDVF